MLSFFSRCPNVSGQVWENFYPLKDLTLEKIRAEEQMGLIRSHSVEIINSMINNPKEYFNYNAYEYTCNKNDSYEAFSNLKKVMYINDNPFDEDGSTLKYGEVSINKLPCYDEMEDLDSLEDFERTLKYALSKRGTIFYSTGLDWVKVVLTSLEGFNLVEELKTILLTDESFKEALEYLLSSKIACKGYLEIVKDKMDWLGEVEIC